MTPPTPMTIPTPTPLNTPIGEPKEVRSEPIPNKTSPNIDPSLGQSPIEIVANSPAYYQSMRNKKRLAVLEQFNNQGNNSLLVYSKIHL